MTEQWATNCQGARDGAPRVVTRLNHGHRDWWPVMACGVAWLR